MKNFWIGFEKVAKGFRFGGYAMDLLKASKKPVAQVAKPAVSVSRAATAATSAAKATPSGTFSAVTKRPAKYIDL